jgi:1-acyl-sn-glycerol-3-phosphate acyltransferase
MSAQPLVPPLGDSVPRWGNALTRTIGRTGLRVLGWRLAGSVPNVPKLVAIAAPHTCTLDVFVGLAVMLALGARVHWLGKHTIFWEPLGVVLRWMGGIPVDRSHPGGLTGQAMQLMRDRADFYLALAPEGTRRKVERWKTGFYRIAHAAGVPIVPVALDYRRRIADILEPIVPSGDYAADLAKLRALFCAEMARHPQRY